MSSAPAADLVLLVSSVRVPGGRVTYAADTAGIVRAGSFRGRADLRLPPGATVRSGPTPSIQDALAAYADGAVELLDAVPVAQPGSAFQQACWQQMRRIPAGSVITYGELALRAGRPRASRAAGSACARNAVAPFVPCHRVVAADGGLGGYGYGLAVKEALLAHEAVGAPTRALRRSG